MLRWRDRKVGEDFEARDARVAAMSKTVSELAEFERRSRAQHERRQREWALRVVEAALPDYENMALGGK